MSLTLTEVPSPIGVLYVIEGNNGVCALGFEDESGVSIASLERRFGSKPRPAAQPSPGARRLRAYLDGDLDALDDVRVDLHGTPFQQRVWAALRKVRRGRTATYSQIAQALGQPTATRAVGLANARNPVAIVVPCHRIVGADGTLTGYAGGLDRKRWLLRHEGIPV
jgi:methylated-DNA-[protein]-cysteine S-methyltransferase